MDKQTKFLAINFGGLGDEILFLPTLQSIRQEHPDWHITLLTEPRASAIKQLSNLIDENICFDIKKKPMLPTDLWQLVSLLRSGKYDIVLSSGSSMKVSALLFLSGIKTRIGYDSGSLSHSLLTKAVPLNCDQHAVSMYHDLTKGLGIAKAAQPPQIIADQESRQYINSLFGENKNKVRLLIHPGMSKLAMQKGIYKHWPNANWCQLIKQLLEEIPDAQVILAGGPDDDDCIAEITRMLPKEISQSPRFFLAYGKTKKVAHLAALIEYSSMLICIDSAPMHMAAALQKPLVALFGPTDPQKLLIASPNYVAIEDKGQAKILQNREMSALGQTANKNGLRISTETVFNTVKEKLTLKPLL